MQTLTQYHRHACSLSMHMLPLPFAYAAIQFDMLSNSICPPLHLAIRNPNRFSNENTIKPILVQICCPNIC